MANTVTLLSYANTFGDQLVTINALAQENNNMAANNYIKPTGTLYLNDPTLGLQVANNAVVAGQLQVQGTGSSAYIQNNLRVDTQVYFTNTTIGLTNSGQANIGGPLLALGANTGLQVANSASVGANLIVYQSSTLVGSSNVGNTLNVVGATSLQNTLTVAQNASFSANINAARYINVTNDVNATDFIATQSITGSSLNINNNATILGQLQVAGNFVITGSTVNSSNNFTLNANSGSGVISTFGVYRGASANAYIRWNESSQYWDIRDVNNPSSYSKILTANLISDSVITVNSNGLASQTAANTLNNSIIAVNSLLAANTAAINATATSNFNTLNNYLIANVATLNASVSSNVSTLNSSISSNVATLNNSISSNVAVLTGWVNAANTNAANATYLTQGTIPAARFPTSGASAGTYGSVSAIPVLTVDATGRVTSITQTNITGTYAISISGNAATTSQTNFSNLTIGSSQVLYAGNYNSYSPTLTGTGASGTWPISISGTAAVASSVSGSNVSGNIPGNASNITSYTINQSVGTGNDVQHNSLGLGTSAPGGGNLNATGNITAYYSDMRLKTNLGPIQNPLDKVMALNGFYYEANETAQALGYTAKREVGVSAQDVQSVLPEIVSPAPIDSQYLTINYERLVPLLIEAIKELKSEIDELKKK